MSGCAPTGRVRDESEDRHAVRSALVRSGERSARWRQPAFQDPHAPTRCGDAELLGDGALSAAADCRPRLSRRSLCPVKGVTYGEAHRVTISRGRRSQAASPHRREKGLGAQWTALSRSSEHQIRACRVIFRAELRQYCDNENATYNLQVFPRSGIRESNPSLELGKLAFYR